MASLPSEEWLRKRKVTARLFNIQAFFLGVEYSVVFLTLWVYITTLVPTNYPKLVYSLTASAYNISAILVSLIVGKIIDRTRNIRAAFLALNTLVILGNIIYAMHYSPICLIAGRFIAGTGGTLRAVISSEIARSFPPESLAGQYSVMSLGFSLGFIVGPALNSIFALVNFSLGTLKIQAGNVCGIYMAFFFCCLQIAVCIYVHDLSKEFDLKAEAVKQADSEAENTTSATTLLKNDTLKANDSELRHNIFSYSWSHHSIGHSDTNGDIISKSCAYGTAELTEVTFLIPQKKSRKLWCLITNTDILLIYGLTFLSQSVLVTFDLYIPLMCIKVLKWSLLPLNAVMFGTAVLALVSFLLIACISPKSKGLYYMMLVSLIASLFLQFCFYFIGHYRDHLEIVIPLWCIWSVLFVTIILSDALYLVTTLANMISSENQTFAESIRQGFSRSGSIIALLGSVYLFDYLFIFSITVTSMWFVGLLLFLWKGKRLAAGRQAVI